MRALAERQVDGMLLAPTVGALEHALPYLEPSRACRSVLLDRFVDAPLDQVGCDNEQPTARLVEHLIGIGHRRIAMAIGIPGLSTTDERVRGYRMALEQGGLAVRPGAGGRGRLAARPRARRRCTRCSTSPDPPTAVVSGNNFMTIGLLRAIAERGLTVPDDIALVAFDDFEWADLFAPRLTVIRQPTTELGSRAVELLLSRLEDPRPPAAHRAARGDVRAPRLMRVHRSFTCARRFARNPEGMVDFTS